VTRHLRQVDRLTGRAWAGLEGDALAWALPRAFAGPLLVVVDEPDAADRLVRALRFFHPKPSQVELFPADDNRPYDGFSPSPELAAQRNKVLHLISTGKPLMVVVPARALLQRVPTAAERKKGTSRVRPGDEIDRDDLVRALQDAGYSPSQRVEVPATYAVRGDVLDVWGPGAARPRRLDFFDDEVELIRSFDPETQRTVAKASGALLLPAREDRTDRSALDRLHKTLAPYLKDRSDGIRRRRAVVEELEDDVRFAGVEDYLPGLVDTMDPVTALGDLPVVAVHPTSIGASIREFLHTVKRRYTELPEDERPLLPPDTRYTDGSALRSLLSTGTSVYHMAAEGSAEAFDAESVADWGVRAGDLNPLVKRLNGWLADDAYVGIVAPSERRVAAIQALLAGHNLPLRLVDHPSKVRAGELSLMVGDITQGFASRTSHMAFLPASVLFGGGGRASTARHKWFKQAVESTADLKPGDYVVHTKHGVGLFRGVERRTVRGVEQDLVHLEYAKGDQLYVPVARLNDLSRYTAGESAKVPLDRLGGQTWERRKGRVRDALLGRANDMLKLQAARDTAERPAYPEPGDLYGAFSASFPYTETPDQAKAIADIQDDLSAPHPMDRLVCGDVGFGKTEVAMRAAMRVVEAGGQVAVLCPTAILAYQHQIKFQDRFGPFDLNVRLLSRFGSATDRAETLASLADGSTQIAIGTHRLLGKSVEWKNLRMVIIDEEHRFGVAQKNRLKKLRAEVDVLSMSATPIPRTLQMALSGMRPMSIIATPPRARLAVRTTTSRFTESRIRDAIQTELERAGQVFFVHNRVETIRQVAEQLQSWLPNVRFGVAHGQMPSEKLESQLLSFMQRDFDVLVATSVIESGIDLPNVNTMIIDRADRFGLAQLHQLRGRVGRSNVRGNCLLLLPEQLEKTARRRVQALLENSKLGAGFAIASADLEIRGGGNLLGEAQSGHIAKVGYQVWLELLEEAIATARGQAARRRIEPDIEVPVPAFLPENLLPDIQERMRWYRRFANADSIVDVNDIVGDLRDRFGELPEPVHALAGATRVRVACQEIGIQRVSWMKVRAELVFARSSRLSKERLRKVAAAHPARFQLKDRANPVLEVRFRKDEAARPYLVLRWAFEQLGLSGV